MVNKVLFSSNTEEWQTPKWLFDKINELWKIDLDPCTTKDNPLQTPYFYSKESDGLKSTWHGNVFVNPPYNREIEKWLQKAKYELETNRFVERVIFLLPVRTDTKWFHTYIYDDWILKFRKNIEYIWFIKGRLKFGSSKNSAPFPSMIVVFKKD